MDAIETAISSAMDTIPESAPADAPPSALDRSSAAESAAPAETPSATSPAEASPVSPSAASTPDPVAPPDQDDVDQYLESIGIKAPVPGERGPRLDFKAVKRILTSATKKAQESHATQLGTVREQLRAEADQARQESQRVLAERQAFDHALQTDPQRVLGLLAVLHPQQYGAIVQQLQHGNGPQAPPAQPQDPMPQPDAKFPDGSIGYSVDQHAKLLDWRDRQTEQRTTQRLLGEMSRRFGPIEQQFRQQQIYQQAVPKVQGIIGTLHRAFGQELIAKHESDIVTAMQADPRLSPAEAAALVLMPKLQPNRDAMRADILRDLQGRPKAAARTSVSGGVDGNGASSDPITDAIKGAMAAHHLT